MLATVGRSRWFGKYLSAQFSSLQSANVLKKTATFPREREGNDYDVNFSLLEDGITSVGDSFRNARIPLLVSRLPVKVTDKSVQLTTPKLTGVVKIQEAGDSISLDNFSNLKKSLEILLSSNKDLFVEDAALAGDISVRVGVRIVTQLASTALIFRRLLVPIPDRKVDHRKRFDGWHNDERWRVSNPVWKDGKYEILDRPVESKGERPITTFIGGDNGNVALQFVERGGKVVGMQMDFYVFCQYVIVWFE